VGEFGWFGRILEEFVRGKNTVPDEKRNGSSRV